MEKDYKDVKNVFFCYSLRIFHILKASGERYLYKDVHPTTKRHFWAFPRTENLDKVLSECNEMKKQYMANKKK